MNRRRRLQQVAALALKMEMEMEMEATGAWRGLEPAGGRFGASLLAAK